MQFAIAVNLKRSRRNDWFIRCSLQVDIRCEFWLTLEIVGCEISKP